MGMHEPGWREANEERAWEEWRADVRAELATIRRMADHIQETLDTGTDSAAILGISVGTIEHATEAIWKIRHGPENPADA